MASTVGMAATVGMASTISMAATISMASTVGMAGMGVMSTTWGCLAAWRWPIAAMIGTD
jgi:hypothetical protein